MLNADFRVGITGAGKLVQYLRVNHGATCFKSICAEEVSAEELKRAVDISHVYIKNESHQFFPAPGVQFPHPGILAVDTIPYHGPELFNEREKANQVTDVELPVGVHKEGELFGYRLEAGYQGRAVPPVDRAVDQAYAWIVGLQLLDNFSRAVFAPIVDHYYFEISHPGSEYRHNVRDGIGDEGLLVVGRQHHRDAARGH